MDSRLKMNDIHYKGKSYFFSLWISVLFFLVFSVPFLLASNFIFLAKLNGVLSLLVLLVALNFWKKVSRNRNKVKTRIELTVNDTFYLKNQFQWFNLLSKENQRIIENRIGLFLGYTKINSSINICRDQFLKFALFDVLLYWDDVQLQKYREEIDILFSKERVFNITSKGYSVSEEYVNDVLESFRPDSTSKEMISDLSYKLKNEWKNI